MLNAQELLPTLGLVGEEVSLRGLDLLPQSLHVETRALLHRRKFDEGLGEFAALGQAGDPRLWQVDHESSEHQPLPGLTVRPTHPTVASSRDRR
jgi:hypothetical protein